MLRAAATGMVLALGLGVAASAQALPPAQPPGVGAQPLAPADFLAMALQSDQFEEDEGRLASMRALDPAVRALAGKMVHDHAQSMRAFATAAVRAHLPNAPPPGLDLGQQQQFEQLKATTGAAFDRAYVNQQVRAHLKALALMTSFVRGGPSGPLRQTALRVRPTISRHLAAFERLQTAVG